MIDPYIRCPEVVDSVPDIAGFVAGFEVFTGFPFPQLPTLFCALRLRCIASYKNRKHRQWRRTSALNDDIQRRASLHLIHCIFTEASSQDNNETVQIYALLRWPIQLSCLPQGYFASSSHPRLSVLSVYLSSFPPLCNGISNGSFVTSSFPRFVSFVLKQVRSMAVRFILNKYSALA